MIDARGVHKRRADDSPNKDRQESAHNLPARLAPLHREGQHQGKEHRHEMVAKPLGLHEIACKKRKRACGEQDRRRSVKPALRPYAEHDDQTNAPDQDVHLQERKRPSVGCVETKHKRQALREEIWVQQKGGDHITKKQNRSATGLGGEDKAPIARVNSSCQRRGHRRQHEHRLDGRHDAAAHSRCNDKRGRRLGAANARQRNRRIGKQQHLRKMLPLGEIAQRKYGEH